MLKIKDQYFVSLTQVEGTNLSLVRAEMFCDTVSDLPAVDAIDGCILDMGSIAYIIDPGDVYVLNSEGTWKNANGEDNAAIASVNNNTRQLDEPIQDIAKTAEALKNEPESIPEDAYKVGDIDALRDFDGF